MKKLIILIVIIGVILALFLISGGGEIDLKKGDGPKETTSFKPDMSNASFTFEDETVTLSNGSYSGDIVPGSAIKEEVILTRFVAYGDLNNDKKGDAAGLLVQSGGGSGVFVHLVAYTSGNVNYKGSNALFIGDRISPQSISISDGVITLTYLDRKENEPLASEPTVEVSKKFIYKSGELQER